MKKNNKWSVLIFAILLTSLLATLVASTSAYIYSMYSKINDIKYTNSKYTSDANLEVKKKVDFKNDSVKAQYIYR